MPVAIIGLGPKGLFALERLLHRLADSDPCTDVEIDLYEPCPVPGAGPVYAPDQPDHLRMNFRAEQVDLWPVGSRAVPFEDQLSFVEWRGATDDPYAPRAEVGRYLAAGLDLLLRHAPDGASVRLIARRVIDLRRDGAQWIVATDDDSKAYDEVLIATGHEQRSTTALASSWKSSIPLIEGVFPTAEFLSESRVPPGSVVGARGFALSFIDAALALTEGRGGRFEPLNERLHYKGADGEVDTLMPYSRTGRPMLAKPAQPEDRDRPELAAARERIAKLPEAFSLRDDLLPVIGDAAGSLAPHEAPAIEAALAGACDGTPPPTSLSPEQELRQSLSIALGNHVPDLTSSLGSAWRGLYPALVARLGGYGLEADQWRAFRRLSVNMERLAFGPSPTNVMKLLALSDAGRVDLSHLHAADWRELPRVDVVIDTVLAAPGVAESRNPLLDQLLSDGHVRIPPHRRGIEVLPDATCIGREGTVTEGLAAIGRVTEDSVIGNDTLSRTLHPAADLWADRVLASLRVASPAAVS